MTSAEVYDTRSDTWEVLPEMNSLRSNSTAVAAENKFVVIGGYGAPRLIGGFLQVNICALLKVSQSSDNVYILKCLVGNEWILEDERWHINAVVEH